jgi:hypothetical protein
MSQNKPGLYPLQNSTSRQNQIQAFFRSLFSSRGMVLDRLDFHHGYDVWRSLRRLFARSATNCNR